MKQYIKPEIEIVAARTYAAMMLSSWPEDEQISGDDAFMSKGDVGDDEGDAWPSYSVWDE